ncbi:MAG: polyketide cyclase [Nitrosarchaeum sp.]
MQKIIFEKIIKADRNKVFDVTTNYENFQKLVPQYYPSIRIISVRGNVSIVEEHLRIGGDELVMLVKHVIDTPVSHDIFVIGGDAKGTHIAKRYEFTPNGTKIIVEINWKQHGLKKLVGIFSKNKILDEYGKILDEFAIIAEA